MSGSILSPLFGVFIAVMIVAVVLSVVAWRWAVRRPQHDMTDIPSSTPRPLVYAAIGASDVVGVGARDPATEGWANVVYSRMPPGTQFERLGRSGITLREANNLEIPAAVKAGPDLITMWNCVNDAVRITPIEQYTSDLRHALDALTRRTEARIMVLNLPDMSLIAEKTGNGAHKELVRAGVQHWNKAMEQVVSNYDHRVHLLDLFDVSHEVEVHPEYISGDRFHPSTEGYRRLGDLVWSAIVANGWAPEGET